LFYFGIYDLGKIFKLISNIIKERVNIMDVFLNIIIFLIKKHKYIVCVNTLFMLRVIFQVKFFKKEIMNMFSCIIIF